MIPVDVTVLTSFALLWAVVVPTPGANSLMVTHVALTRGPRHVAIAIAGNMLGNVLLAAAALLGTAALLQSFPWLRLAVHVLGGIYLMYFGGRLLLRSRRAPVVGADGAAGHATAAAGWRTLALGFATALSNAQAILFLTSIFAVAGVLDAGIPTGIACIATMIAMNASYLGLIGWLFLRQGPRRIYARFRHWIEGTIGTLFVGFGARLIWRSLVTR